MGADDPPPSWHMGLCEESGEHFAVTTVQSQMRYLYAMHCSTHRVAPSFTSFHADRDDAGRPVRVEVRFNRPDIGVVATMMAVAE